MPELHVGKFDGIQQYAIIQFGEFYLIGYRTSDDREIIIHTEPTIPFFTTREEADNWIKFNEQMYLDMDMQCDMDVMRIWHHIMDDDPDT